MCSSSPAQPQPSCRNPFIDDKSRSCQQEGTGHSWSQNYSAPALQTTVRCPDSNPFSSAHVRSFVHSTPAPFSSKACTPAQHTPSHGLNGAISYGQTPVHRQPGSKLSKTHFLSHQPLSDNEEEGDPRERVPTLTPGQYDGTTPWKEFLHRFESCAEANYWNPRSSKWDYRRLVDELEIAHGPSSDHAAAVAVELRQRARKAGEALHTFKDDIYGKVTVAYGDRAEIEQDLIPVEVFTNGLGDAEVVQKLLKQRPATLARAYEIAHTYETTRRAASYVTSVMQPGARNLAERRPRAAMVRAKDKNEAITNAASVASPSYDRYVPRTPSASNSRRNFTKGGGCCHNCQGWGHIQKPCPSPHKITKTLPFARTPCDNQEPTVLHLKGQNREMSIHMRLFELEVCAVLDSGAHYITIMPFTLT
ncbi:hypothetical protein XENOCAPTIV_020354 [Xenoophorus captivus]|uniref:CCHC-type domain-containing protein n=1 Tax=Xenoophorus captivus TaxID=1517983 RepID=A0ABV0QSR9_9TELE